MELISIIIPCYNEEHNIEKNINEIQRVISDLNYEFKFILIDDGSVDKTSDVIKRLCLNKKEIGAIIFSKNFGKEAAIKAGLDNANGDGAIIMDADLQHPPTMIKELFKYWRQEYNIVECIKANRKKQGFIYNLFAKCYYRFFLWLAGFDLNNTSDFKLLDKTAIKLLRSFDERNRIFRALTIWSGLKTKQIFFNVEGRASGKSAWTKYKLIKYGINTILNFSSIPLYLVLISGFIFIVFGIILTVITLLRYFNGQSVQGFATVNISICVSGSIIMFALGIIGSYLSKIYNELKHRPFYIDIQKYNI